MPFDLYPPQSSDTRRHLLSVTDLDRAAIERILDTAHGFESVMQRDVKKVPTLRGRTVMNLFFESSTRTSSSFELAAKRLSADTMSLKASGSSVDKGESLKDTVTTLSAYDPDVIVIRHPRIGAPADHHRLHRRPRRQRRRRQAPAPHPVPARPVHDQAIARKGRRPARRDRRRRAALARRALQHPGAADAGSAGHRDRPAAADPARHRGHGCRDLTRHRRHRLGRRGVRPADAARAHAGGRQLRSVARRIHRSLGCDRRSRPPRPAGDAPRADEPRGRDRLGGRRRPRARASSTRCGRGWWFGWPCCTTC